MQTAEQQTTEIKDEDFLKEPVAHQENFGSVSETVQPEPLENKYINNPEWKEADSNGVEMTTRIDPQTAEIFITDENGVEKNQSQEIRDKRGEEEYQKHLGKNKQLLEQKTIEDLDQPKTDLVENKNTITVKPETRFATIISLDPDFKITYKTFQSEKTPGEPDQLTFQHDTLSTANQSETAEPPTLSPAEPEPTVISLDEVLNFSVNNFEASALVSDGFEVLQAQENEFNFQDYFQEPKTVVSPAAVEVRDDKNSEEQPKPPLEPEQQEPFQAEPLRAIYIESQYIEHQKITEGIQLPPNTETMLEIVAVHEADNVRAEEVIEMVTTDAAERSAIRVEPTRREIPLVQRHEVGQEIKHGVANNIDELGTATQKKPGTTAEISAFKIDIREEINLEDEKEATINIQSKSEGRNDQSLPEKRVSQTATVVKFYHTKSQPQPHAQVSALKIEARKEIIHNDDEGETNKFKSEPQQLSNQTPKGKFDKKTTPAAQSYNEVTTVVQEHKITTPVLEEGEFIKKIGPTAEISALKIDFRDEIIVEDEKEAMVNVQTESERQYDQILREPTSLQIAPVVKFYNSEGQTPSKDQVPALKIEVKQEIVIEDEPDNLKDKAGAEIQEAFYHFLEQKGAISIPKPLQSVRAIPTSATPSVILKILQRIIPPQKDANHANIALHWKAEPIRDTEEPTRRIEDEIKIIQKLILPSSVTQTRQDRPVFGQKIQPIRLSAVKTADQDVPIRQTVQELRPRRSLPLDQTVDEVNNQTSTGNQTFNIAA